MYTEFDLKVYEFLKTRINTTVQDVQEEFDCSGGKARASLNRVHSAKNLRKHGQKPVRYTSQVKEKMNILETKHITRQHREINNVTDLIAHIENNINKIKVREIANNSINIDMLHRMALLFEEAVQTFERTAIFPDEMV